MLSSSWGKSSSLWLVLKSLNNMIGISPSPSRNQNSLHLVWKYALIFVCWHYLFQDVNSSRKTLLGTENVWGPKIQAYFHPKYRLLCFLSLKHLWTAWCVLCGMFSFECSLVDFTTKQIFPFFYNIHYILSHCELNNKQRLITVLATENSVTWCI